MPDECQILADQIKAMRERLGISQAEFGTLLGKSGRSIRNWEIGQFGRKGNGGDAATALPLFRLAGFVIDAAQRNGDDPLTVLRTLLGEGA